MRFPVYGLALGLTACGSAIPDGTPAADLPIEVSAPAGAPIRLSPDNPVKSTSSVGVNPDGRVKYRTSPDCHYVNYDGSCKFKKYPSYRIN
jgi:hypothetical protein